MHLCVTPSGLDYDCQFQQEASRSSPFTSGLCGPAWPAGCEATGCSPGPGLSVGWRSGCERSPNRDMDVQRRSEPCLVKRKGVPIASVCLTVSRLACKCREVSPAPAGMMEMEEVVRRKGNGEERLAPPRYWSWRTDGPACGPLSLCMWAISVRLPRPFPGGSGPPCAPGPWTRASRRPCGRRGCRASS